ncbi:MAG: TIGR01777 family oxidoreductase [Brooklawnia sp.]|uniref:TIGR01777 family oxidoreductase n=1 Tax=Brooklawnia sp. TaxID=2699740 RepID=UPI003C732FCE
MATIAIGGASGLIGTALTAYLRGRGDTVLRLVRGPAVQPDEVGWNPEQEELHHEPCGEVDVFVNLAGANVARHWTVRRKQLILSSRVRSTRTLARAAATLGPHVALVNASGVGYYGDRGREPLTEHSRPGSDWLADVVQQWEQATSEAARAGNRVALARTGLVLSRTGGALGPLMPLLKLGLGAPLGPGSQIWPWIGLVDEVRALTWLIDHPIEGPVNLASPATSTNREVIRAVAHAMGRPVLPIGAPVWLMRLVVGQFAERIVDSQNQVPQVLLESGFAFEQQTVDEVASWLADREDSKVS